LLHFVRNDFAAGGLGKKGQVWRQSRHTCPFFPT